MFVGEFKEGFDGQAICPAIFHLKEFLPPADESSQSQGRRLKSLCFGVRRDGNQDSQPQTEMCLMMFQKLRYSFAASLMLAAFSFTSHSQTTAAPTSIGVELYAGLNLSGTVGANYQIQCTGDLNAPGDWTTLTNIVLPISPHFWLDLSSPGKGKRFYRAVLVTPTVAAPPANPDTARLVWIVAGKFTMGSPVSDGDADFQETPQTQVTLSHGFWIGKHEVTQEDYLAVTGLNPSKFTGDLTRPVEKVNWQEAVDYCVKLTERERQAGRLPAGHVYRLPTEAEWEYACRAGTATRFSYSDDSSYAELGSYGWFFNNGGFASHTIGQKTANPWGLFDMHGNVAEWCQNWDGLYPGGSVTDPKGPATGSFKVCRGGSFGVAARICRSAARDLYSPAFHYDNVGLRVVLALDQP